MKYPRVLALILFPYSVLAEGGATLYKTYCSACHGEDGVGPENNVNPPLAKSEWITGAPDRAISAVLVGLSGPMEVKGKLYHLIMPPQGAVLNDKQLAAILTYVRKSWGNKAKAVSAAQVAKVRADLGERTEPFTANELLQKHPIQYRQGWPRLENLTSRFYRGKWEVMPDFSKLEAFAYEEEPRNLVDVAHANLDKEFGIVWEGQLVTSKEGDYNAILDASDGVALYLNDKLILEVEGVGSRGSERARIRRFRLGKGEHQFRLEYFNNQGSPGLSFKMSGPTGAPWLSESRLEIQPSAPPIPLVAPEGGAVFYRNFIAGARPKAIGVGYDGGVNQAFSIEHLGPDLIWQGDFMDGGRHWTNRGTGFQEPAGEDVVQLLNKPGFAILKEPSAVWPNRNETELPTNYGGYSLDERRRPSFRYEIGGMRVVEKAIFSEQNGRRQLVRKMTFDSGGSDATGLHLALAIGPKVVAVEGGFRVDDTLTITTSSDQGLVPFLRNQNGDQLLVPLKSENDSSNLIVTYTWNKR